MQIDRNGLDMICPVRALIRLVENTPADRLLDTGGSGITVEGVVWVIIDLARRTGVTPISVRHRLPRLSADDRLAIALHLQQPSDSDLRDRALLTALFWGCFRGSEVAQTRFGELKFVEQGIEWSRPKKKNRQRHDSPPRALPVAADPFVCPVTAMNEWLERLSVLHGRPLHGDDPVFPPLQQKGLHRSMSRDSANNVVRALANRAGLTGRYGSHSPRAGFVTTAIDANIPREHIQRHGDWVSSKGLDPYYRRTQTWSPTSNAAMRLAQLAQLATEA